MVNLLGSGANLAALSGPGAFVQIVAPPPIIQGAQTDAFGVVGTASWGPVNQVVPCGDSNAATSQFGGITAAALNDPHDLCSDAYLAFGQGSPGVSINGQLVRVTDGTDAKATLTLQGSSGPGVALTACYTGSMGNQIKARVAGGSLPGTVDVTILPPSTMGTAELFSGLPATGAAFFSALINAINNGTSQRGPSAWFDAASAGSVSAAGNPVLGTFQAAGGTDGRNVNTATLVGTGTVYPGTGLFALESSSPSPSVVWCAGLLDRSADAQMVALDQVAGWTSFLQLPQGNATASAAQASLSATGIAASDAAYIANWATWQDPINQVPRFTPATAIIAGTWCCLGPQESTLNKPVNLVSALERSTPMTVSEAGIFDALGVLLITNPIPAGPQFGVRTGSSTALPGATKPIEYWRTTCYLARSADSVIGQFVGMNQGFNPSDPLRDAVEACSNQFLSQLVGLGQIDSYQVTCAYSATGNGGLGINTPQSIAGGLLSCLWQVRYLATVKYFVLSLQGGTTVSVSVTNAAGAA